MKQIEWEGRRPGPPRFHPRKRMASLKHLGVEPDEAEDLGFPSSKEDGLIEARRGGWPRPPPERFHPRKRMASLKRFRRGDHDGDPRPAAAPRPRVQHQRPQLPHEERRRKDAERVGTTPARGGRTGWEGLRPTAFAPSSRKQKAQEPRSRKEGRTLSRTRIVKDRVT